MKIYEKKVDLDWASLGFKYFKTDYRFQAISNDGETWEKGELIQDENIVIHEGSPAIHYGQQCFEGLKAYSDKDGTPLLFRPSENAKRLSDTSQRLLIPPVPEEMFLDGVKQVVMANYKWLPPHGYGATLYIRPVVIGVGENLGIRRAPQYIFRIFVSPVGPYFTQEDMKPISMAVTDYDRAAPQGIGNYKAGSNYAGGLDSTKRAKKLGAQETLYLDATERRYLDEAGAANILVRMKDDEFTTPKSQSILPSITRKSIMILAEKELGLRTTERKIDFLKEYENMSEMAACGTAAVLSPIGKIFLNDKWYKFYDDGNSVGPTMKKLYDRLVNIQFGDEEENYGWVVRLDQ